MIFFHLSKCLIVNVVDHFFGFSHVFDNSAFTTLVARTCKSTPENVCAKLNLRRIPQKQQNSAAAPIMW